jgi:hypothetical protein
VRGNWRSVKRRWARVLVTEGRGERREESYDDSSYGSCSGLFESKITRAIGVYSEESWVLGD